MTAQEAIKVIETNFCDECIMTSCEHCAHGKAKQALEKQIPKKPYFGTVHNYTTYYCDGCKKFVGFYDTRTYEYCHNCGQKLDWN